jgi:hypothetical protein
VTQKGTLRVAFGGKITPYALPRIGVAPVAVSLGGHITTTTAQSTHPQLRTITLAINRDGRLDYQGLPVCHYRQIYPATNVEALENCRDALVGTGTFTAHVLLPEQSPFPSNGRVLAFNGKVHGRPVIFAHIYGTTSLPTSFVLPFSLTRTKGTFATTLTAHLPLIAANWGFINGVSLRLFRRFRYRGKVHSYLSAGCPAAKGFPGAVFPFARATYGFDTTIGNLATTMVRSCKVRG